MASTYEVTPTNPEWQRVSEQLLGMLRMLESNDNRPLNLLKFAETYAALARVYRAAIESEGRSSMRAEAAAKALDLRTAKSELLAFLGREDGPMHT
jgi:hypothetical protein